MKVLIVLPFIPYGKTSGGHLAVINMLDYLRSKCSLTIAFFCRHHNVPDIARLQELWPDVDLRPYKYWEHKTTLKGPGNVLDALVSKFRPSLNPSVTIRKNSLLGVDSESSPQVQGFYSFVLDILKEGFDIVQTEFMDYLDLGYYLPTSVKTVFIHHELRFVRLENEMSLFPKVTPSDKARFQYVKDLEISRLSHYDAVVTLTQTDKDILSEYLPSNKVFCSPASIPFGKLSDFKECGNEFAFVGGSSHYPNLDGLLWLCSEVLPILRGIMKNFKIYVVGNWDSKYKKAVCRKNPEIVFTGYVPDITSALCGRISIMPIRIGSGMRIKILEAVGCHSPFVTTAKGVEGQDFVPEQECLLADSAESFARQMARLSADKSLQRILAQGAWTKLSSSYNPTSLFDRRFEIYNSITHPLIP